jgi:prepilin-type processing-associated H-X9-DG protein
VANETICPIATRIDATPNMAAIMDGTSNTIMFGERAWTNHIAANWAARIRGTTASHGFRANVKINTPFPNPNSTSGGDNAACIRYALYSLHSGGVNVGFADGSVRFLSENIGTDPTTIDGSAGCSPPRTNFTYQALYHRDDGFTPSGF